MMPSNRLSHTLLGGALWVVGYFVLMATTRVMSRLLAAAIPVSYRPVVTIVLAFIVGAVVGALAYEYDEARRFGQ
jgi:hypothetical protein